MNLQRLCGTAVGAGRWWLRRKETGLEHCLQGERKTLLKIYNIRVPDRSKLAHQRSYSGFRFVLSSFNIKVGYSARTCYELNQKKMDISIMSELWFFFKKKRKNIQKCTVSQHLIQTFLLTATKVNHATNIFSVRFSLVLLREYTGDNTN